MQIKPLPLLLTLALTACTHPTQLSSNYLAVNNHRPIQTSPTIDIRTTTPRQIQAAYETILPILKPDSPTTDTNHREAAAAALAALNAPEPAAQLTPIGITTFDTTAPNIPTKQLTAHARQHKAAVVYIATEYAGTQSITRTIPTTKRINTTTYSRTGNQTTTNHTTGTITTNTQETTTEPRYITIAIYFGNRP